MKNIGFVFLLFSLFVAGCESNPSRQSEHLPVYELKVNSSSNEEVFKGDVGIALKSITMERALENENLIYRYRWWNPRNTRKSWTDARFLVNLPAFEVQVTNTMDHSVSFQKVSIRLLDDAGNSYQAQLKEDIKDEVNNRVRDVRGRGWSVNDSSAQDSVRLLKLFDKNYESLPGITEKRVLSFDLENSSNFKSYRDMMSGARYFRVIMYNVPVEVDAAGNVSKVERFEFLFDVVRK